MSKYQKYYLEIKPLYFDIKGMLNLLFNKTFNTHNRTPNHLNKSTTDKRMCVVNNKHAWHNNKIISMHA